MVLHSNTHSRLCRKDTEPGSAWSSDMITLDDPPEGDKEEEGEDERDGKNELEKRTPIERTITKTLMLLLLKPGLLFDPGRLIRSRGLSGAVGLFCTREEGRWVEIEGGTEREEGEKWGSRRARRSERRR